LEVNGTASKTTASGWLANSDKRIKTDIQDIDNSIELIKHIRPVRFKYTESWRSLYPEIEDRYYYNFIAQEFQEVYPNSVQGSGEFLENDPVEILQIDTYDAQITGLKALQELIYRVEELEKENTMLKSQVLGRSNAELNLQKMQADNDNIKADYALLKAEMDEIRSMLGLKGSE
jgi:hypothetical protein